MIRDFLTALLVIVAIVSADLETVSRQPPSNTTPGNATPGNATPGNATPGAPSLDPSAAIFTTATGMVLHAVKPGAVADYEAVITALQKALAESQDEHTRQVASGWRVFKATEHDAKGNVLYVHVLYPAVPDTDYRPSLWLDKLLRGAPPELLAKYRDSFAMPPTQLSLTELAHMIQPPAAPPANASPGNTTPPKPPGR